MLPIQENDLPIMLRVGQYFMAKWRKRLEEVGQEAVLAQMRKQGIPPEVATALLYANTEPT